MKTFFLLSRIKFITVLFFGVASLGYSVDSKAWGRLGHQAICDATWRNSSPEIKKELVAVAKRMGARTFADACIIADTIRNEDQYAWTSPLHYINVERSAKRVNGSDCWNKRSSKPRCVVAAIDYYRQSLKSSRKQQERDFALIMLSHLIGDVHQPLHVSYADDRGGTRLNVIFEGKLLPLHRVWDTEIVTCGIKGSWRQLGKSIARDKSRSSLDDRSPIDWANESLALTRLIYQQPLPRLSKDYCQTFHPIAIERLKLASQRLTHELAGLLGQ